MTGRAHTPDTLPDTLSRLSFTAPETRARRLADMVAERLPTEDARRVLDLGCGSGLPASLLAERRPDAAITGVDLSGTSIAEARRRFGGDGAGEGETVRGIDFFAADYLDWRPAAPFDLIYSEGVLHLIPCPDHALAAKMASELTPGGLLVLVVPHACIGNALLIGLRRVLRALRGPLLERIILALARIPHPTADQAFLAERLPYMFMIPERLDGPKWRTALSAAGLVPVDERPWPRDSLAKLAHRVTVFRKVAEPVPSPRKPEVAS